VVREALSKCDFKGVPEGCEKGFLVNPVFERVLFNPGGSKGFFLDPGVLFKPRRGGKRA